MNVVAHANQVPRCPYSKSFLAVAMSWPGHSFGALKVVECGRDTSDPSRMTDPSWSRARRLYGSFDESDTLGPTPYLANGVLNLARAITWGVSIAAPELRPDPVPGMVR